MTKRLLPVIYIKNKEAVKGPNDTKKLNIPVLELVNKFNEEGADALLIFELSKEDDEHEKNLDTFKEICSIAEMDVYGGGNIKRMEDVKKILYTGCKKAILDYTFETNIAITEEVSKKFGKDKLICYGHSSEPIISNKELVREYFSECMTDCDKCAEDVNKEESLKNFPVIRKENTSFDKAKGLITDYKFSDFKTDDKGLVPVIVTDYKNGDVLMLAYMNEEAYNLTLSTGKMTYFSRSRNEIWVKGLTSGHYQYVKSLCADCDKDTILARVSQVGAACHTGSRSCFFNEIAKKDYIESKNPYQVFEDVFAVIKDRKVNPKEGSYTNYLFDKGIDKILKKVGEECTEMVIAAKNSNPNEIKYEISDFLYHMMVLMAEKNISWEDITQELANR